MVVGGNEFDATQAGDVPNSVENAKAGVAG
jgi:hypothetical protein